MTLLCPFLSLMPGTPQGSWPRLGVLFVQSPSPVYEQDVAFMLILLIRRKPDDLGGMDINLCVPVTFEELGGSMVHRSRRHGHKFVCADPTTWPEPDQEYLTQDNQYGQVHVRAWYNLHAIPQIHPKRGTRGPRPLMRGTLILVEVERLAKRTRIPQQLWLWWHGPEPPQLAQVWRAYVGRFKLKHTFRFIKQFLNWTLPRVRHPEQADRWTWLVVLAYTQLRLARPLVADHRLQMAKGLWPKGS
jgi:hypothetical protein